MSNSSYTRSQGSVKINVPRRREGVRGGGMKGRERGRGEK